MTPTYLVVYRRPTRRHIERPSDGWSLCGRSDVTAVMSGREPELAVCAKCQRAWDKATR